jgi:hypothetical protein
MNRVVLWSALLIMVLGGAVLAYGFSQSRAVRSDCPGTIVCPITGQETCKDRCPLGDANRADCPGTILCPLTGEPVCSDRCPLTQRGERAVTVPSCCAGSR